MPKLYHRTRKKLILLNWRKFSPKLIKMDYNVIKSGKKTTKNMIQSYHSARMKSLFLFKNSTCIAIIGTKFATFSMEEPSNTFITGFNTIQTKTSRKEDGHLCKTSNSLFWLNTSVKRNGLLFRNVSRTEVKSKSGRGFAIFLTLKYQETVGHHNKSKYS